jgi:integrase
MLIRNATPIVTYQETQNRDYGWSNFFDPAAALTSVVAHIASLPSSQTPERHTMRVYQSGLKYFLAWLGGQPLDDLAATPITHFMSKRLPLPTKDAMQQFLAHLSAKGLSTSTISNKYQIPARHWLKALASQHITGLTGDLRDYIEDCRYAFNQAIAVKALKPKEVSNRSSLYRYGTRLELAQINDMLTHLQSKDTLTYTRDLALFYVAITSALRVAELTRITLKSITPAPDCYEIAVRGKRGQIDPVSIDHAAVQLIKNWVNAWNAALNDDPTDPRYIDEHTPIWQPLRRDDTPERLRPNYEVLRNAPDYDPLKTPLGINKYNPRKGISRHALRNIICNHGKRVLGIELAPHDLRRTYAARSVEAGIPLLVVSGQLRHADVGVTNRYVGIPPRPSAALISNHVHFNLASTNTE